MIVKKKELASRIGKVNAVVLEVKCAITVKQKLSKHAELSTLKKLWFLSSHAVMNNKQ